MLKLVGVLLVATLISLVFAGDDDAAYIYGCEIFLQKYDQIKPNKVMIKTLIADDCHDDYVKMADECYPIVEKFLETKPDEAGMTKQCSSEEWITMMTKHKRVWKCLQDLAAQFAQ